MHKQRSRQYQRLPLCKYQVRNDGQTLDAQHAELRSAGAEKVYSEKISGAVTDRPALAKALGALSNGDTLVVCKLDRLARSTRDLLNTLAAIAERGALHTAD